MTVLFISLLKLGLTFAYSVKEGIHFIFFFKFVVGCIEFCFVCLFIIMHPFPHCFDILFLSYTIYVSISSVFMLH